MSTFPCVQVRQTGEIVSTMKSLATLAAAVSVGLVTAAPLASDVEQIHLAQGGLAGMSIARPSYPTSPLQLG